MLILALGSCVNEINQERKYDVAVALDPSNVLRRTRLRSSVSQEPDLGLPIGCFALKYCSQFRAPHGTIAMPKMIEPRELCYLHLDESLLLFAQPAH